MALVLLFVSGVASAAPLNCTAGISKPVASSSPAAMCAQTPYNNSSDITYTSKGVLSVVVSSAAPNQPTSGKCSHHFDYTSPSLTDGDGSWTFSCTGSACSNGVVPSAANNWSCDTPPDDCSTSVGTGSKDLSGSSTDGTCQCPSGKETLNVGTASASCANPCAVSETRNSAGVCVPDVTCQGNLTLVNGTCGCPAGQVQGTFNGVPTCAPTATTNPVAPAAGVTQGGGTIVGSTGQTSTTTPNGDGTYTTTTTINNTTVVNGAAAGSGSGAGVSGVGTATISSGTTTMSVVTDSTGKVISSTSTGTEQKSNDSLTLPSVEPAHAPLDTSGISGAIMSSPIVSAFTTAFARFPTVGGCSIIEIPLFKGMVVQFKEQCNSFDAIRQYLTMFAMVVYGLLSYRIFMRSASGV